MGLKRESSRWIEERFENLNNVAWQNGYGVFSIGQSRVEAVTCYLEGQEAHPRRPGGDAAGWAAMRRGWFCGDEALKEEPLAQSAERARSASAGGCGRRRR